MNQNEQYNELTSKAVNLVTEKFIDKKDKAGKPYLDHLYAVAGDFANNPKLFIIAILHDVIEDTDVTKEDLSRYFGEEIANVVDLLTHKENEPYKAYIERIGTDSEATRVKMSDLRHNMSLWRLDVLTEKDIERLKKYHDAYVYLKSKWV